jgi:hypothetical protein
MKTSALRLNLHTRLLVSAVSNLLLVSEKLLRMEPFQIFVLFLKHAAMTTMIWYAPYKVTEQSKFAQRN